MSDNSSFHVVYQDMQRLSVSGTSRRDFLKYAATTGVTISSLSTLAACANSDPNRPIDITIPDAPDPKDPLAKLDTQAFNALKATFEKHNPHYNIVGHPYNFLPETFYDRLKNGQAEDLNRIYLTEARIILENHYGADVTDTLSKWNYFTSISPFAIQSISDDKGRIFAIPKDGYKLIMTYRRDLFKHAKLDPDKPLLTWDDFRSAARQLKKIMVTPPYIMQTRDRQGGWMFTNWLYSAGGKVEEKDASGNWKCVANNDAGYAVMQLLYEMRWKDQTLWAQKLIDEDMADRKIGGGSAAMQIATIDRLSATPTDTLPKDSIGIFGGSPMPCINGANVSISGGDIWVINAQSSPDIQKGAADYALFMQDLGTYEAQLKTRQTKGEVIGYSDPGVFTGEYLKQMHALEKKYTKVPENIYETVFSSDQKGQLEPAIMPQEWYARLDDVVQKINNTRDLNLKALLDEVVGKFQQEVLDPYNTTTANAK